jgi:predicted porin
MIVTGNDRPQGRFCFARILANFAGGGYTGNYVDFTIPRRITLKKTIVAALAAAATSVAAAQVTVYGVMDQAVRSTDGDTSFVSGSHTTSRLGVKGSEDLGNGLTASFTLEGKLDVTNGDMGGDEMFNRESSVSLGSKTLGTVTLGRTDTSASEGIDTLAGGGNFGNFTNTSGVEYAGDRANTIRYTSPNIGGAEFRIGQSEAVGSAQKLDSASVTFKHKFFSAGVGRDKTASGDTYTAVGAAVNIAGASLGAMHGRREANIDTKVTVISGRVPVGAFAVLGAYSLTDAGGADTKVATLGATYDLSRRTMILAAYQDQAGSDSDFVQVGLVHKF